MDTIKRKKRYRVKSRVRFTIFIIVMLLMTVTAATTVLGLNNADSMTKEEYIQIEVQPGDTLWSIAEEYMPADIDRRKLVHIISKSNDTSASRIQPGQVLNIPVEI